MNNAQQNFFKPVQAFVLLGLFALAATPALANDAGALASKNQCMNCHKVEGRMVGPSFKEVAARYKGDADALHKLTAMVRAGGKGVWGQIPMPPIKSIPDDELGTVVAWILSQEAGATSVAKSVD